MSRVRDGSDPWGVDVRVLRFLLLLPCRLLVLQRLPELPPLLTEVVVEVRAAGRLL